jgi:hypothetical protein
MRQRSRMRIGRLNDAKTSAPQRRVNAQNNPLRNAFDLDRNKNRHNLARFAAHALFHFFKLAKRDAHAHILPVADKLQKEKRLN